MCYSCHTFSTSEYIYPTLQEKHCQPGITLKRCSSKADETINEMAALSVNNRFVGLNCGWSDQWAVIKKIFGHLEAKTFILLVANLELWQQRTCFCTIQKDVRINLPQCDWHLGMNYSVYRQYDVLHIDNMQSDADCRRVWRVQLKQ